MGIREIHYSEISCDRAGCKTVKRVPGSDPDKLPDGWGEILNRVLCPAHYTAVRHLIFPPTRKPRSDRGVPKQKPIQEGPKQPRQRASRRKAVATSTPPPNGLPAGTFQRSDLPELPKCPGCEDTPLHCDVAADVLSRTNCWEKRLARGEIEEGNDAQITEKPKS